MYSKRIIKKTILLILFIFVFSTSANAMDDLTFLPKEDTGPITPIVTSTPPPTNVSRPPTPSAKRTPGPTELDVVHMVSGSITIENDTGKSSDAIKVFSVGIVGEERFTDVSKDNSFNFFTIYTCGMLQVKAKGYLTRFVQLENYIDNKKGAPISMLAGDTNQDGAINMTDAVKIARCFGLSSGSEQYDQICDLNSDSTVNMSDLVIMAKNFNSTSMDILTDSSYKVDLIIEDAKEITENSAYIKGAIYNNGTIRPITPVWIEYWEAANPSKVFNTTSDTIFYYPDFIDRTITGLKPSTTYKYRIKSGIASSQIKEFRTTPEINFTKG